MADYCLYGGIPEGRIIEFSGAEGSGKTSTAFLVAASFQREELKRHPIGEEWELNGEPHIGPRSIIFLDNEGTLDPVWAKNFGYDLSEDADVKTIVIRPEGQNAEEIFDMALDCLKTGDVGLLIFEVDHKRDEVQHLLKERRSAREKTFRPAQQNQETEDKQ